MVCMRCRVPLLQRMNQNLAKNAFVVCVVYVSLQFWWRYDWPVYDSYDSEAVVSAVSEESVDNNVVIHANITAILERYPVVRPDFWNKRFHNQHEFLNDIVHWHTKAKSKVLLCPQIVFRPDCFRLLIAIKSTTTDFRLRQLLRRTWLSQTEWDYRVKLNGKIKPIQVQHIFLLGMQSPNDVEYLQSESEFEDILLGEFADSFQNLSVKEHLFLDYVKELGPDSFDFIYKGDTDVLVNPPMLLDQILRTAARQPDFILGCRTLNMKPFVEQMSKYYVPAELWPHNETYHPYVSGGGFVLTSGLVERMIIAKDHVPIFPIDDAYLGSVLHAAM